MVKIKVGIQGYWALVDVEDRALVSTYRWWIMKTGRMLYARTRIDGKNVMLHNLIAGRGIDHRNRNGLDCQRRNLRPATKSQNAANIIAHRDNKSGIKGIWWNTRDSCWQAQICKDGKKQHLGCFSSATAAKRAYNKAARSLFGVFAI